MQRPKLYILFLSKVIRNALFTIWLKTLKSSENFSLFEWAIPGLFFVIVVLSIQLTVNKCSKKWFYLNPSALVFKRKLCLLFLNPFPWYFYLCFLFALVVVVLKWEGSGIFIDHKRLILNVEPIEDLGSNRFAEIINGVVSSVTRLGDFWKFLATNSPSKVAQKDCWILRYFEKDQSM